jgi:hypothetical protein
LPALRAALAAAGIAVNLDPAAGAELVRLTQRYEAYLHVLASWLVVALPGWLPSTEVVPEETISLKRESPEAMDV